MACRSTFRNWDYPIRRQIFSGFRTARSAVAGDRLMCRHLAYLGPPATLRSVIIDPPHGLYRQAWAPRRQRHGTMNADGFGVGWYAPGDPDPARYRRAGPIWADESFADVARVTRSGAMLAAVRCATPGTDLGAAAVAPFASGRWLFSHNGVVDGWPGVGRRAGRDAARRGAARAGGPGRLGAAVGAGAAPAAAAAWRRARPWPTPSGRCGRRA